MPTAEGGRPAASAAARISLIANSRSLLIRFQEFQRDVVAGLNGATHADRGNLLIGKVSQLLRIVCRRDLREILTWEPRGSPAVANCAQPFGLDLLAAELLVVDTVD